MRQIRVMLTLQYDPDKWAIAYDVEDADEVDHDVREYVLMAAPYGPHLTRVGRIHITEPEETDQTGQWRQTACRHCGQDIEGAIGGTEWRDRGSETHCHGSRPDADGIMHPYPDVPHEPTDDK